jgi:hypothetical protein
MALTKHQGIVANVGTHVIPGLKRLRCVRAEGCVRTRCSIFVTRDMFAVFVSIVYEWFSCCNKMCVIDV